MAARRCAGRRLRTAVTHAPGRAAAPAAFTSALTSLRRARHRPEVALAEAPAPHGLAPYSAALTADVFVGDHELATGRLVLLHDPAGHETWRGVFRLVTYLRADVEPEMVVDPLLPEVGWGWLVEALHEAGAGYVEPSGTVTRVVSEGFGALATRPASAQMEMRASWTPVDANLGPHLHGWCELLCTAAGVPAAPSPGVPLLPDRSPPFRR